MSEGWVRVCVIVAFSPKFQELENPWALLWGLHSAWLMGQTDLSRKGLVTLLRWAEPTVWSSALWGAGTMTWTEPTLKAITSQSDSLHALQGCKDKIQDSLVRMFWPRSQLEHRTLLNEHSPTRTTIVVSRRENRENRFLSELQKALQKQGPLLAETSD